MSNATHLLSVPEKSRVPGRTAIIAALAMALSACGGGGEYKTITLQLGPVGAQGAQVTHLLRKTGPDITDFRVTHASSNNDGVNVCTVHGDTLTINALDPSVQIEKAGSCELEGSGEAVTYDDDGYATYDDVSQNIIVEFFRDTIPPRFTNGNQATVTGQVNQAGATNVAKQLPVTDGGQVTYTLHLPGSGNPIDVNNAYTVWTYDPETTTLRWDGTQPAGTYSAGVTVSDGVNTAEGTLNVNMESADAGQAAGS